MRTHQSSEPTTEEIHRVIQNLRVRKRVNEASGPHVIADCVSCGKVEHLYVNENTGMWDCKVCGESGGLWTLATHMNMRLRDKQTGNIKQLSSMMRTAAGIKVRDAKIGGVDVTLDGIRAASARLFDENDEKGRRVYAYLRGRGFDDETMRRFNLCPMPLRPADAPPQLGVGIPYVEAGRVPLVKLRNLETDKDKRLFMRSKGSHSGLFNVEGIKDCKQVVLCEGELDAVSLWQLGVTNVASTSLGGNKNIPEDWVQALHNAEDVVLFYDDDATGDDAVQHLIQRLGSHRCRIAAIPNEVAAIAAEKLGKAPKDANDLLRAGIPSEWVRKIVEIAKPIANANITTQGAYSDALHAEIMKGDESLGTEIPWANLHELLRGIREGETTLVTGHTSHGKTTWLGELAELIAKGGDPVLKVSLENGPQSEVRKSFQRKMGRPISSINTDAERELALETLSRLDEYPIYILDKKGRVPLDFVLNEIRFARYRYNVRVVFFDHLHYLERDERQDEHVFFSNAIAALQGLAGELGIHIFIVGHPRGSVEQGVVPTHETVKGTSSIKQEIDNSISVYRSLDMMGGKETRKINVRDPSGRKMEISMTATTTLVWVTKARHDDASCGICFFDFNVRGLTYRETTREELANGGKKKTAEHEAPEAARAGVSDPFDP